MHRLPMKFILKILLKNVPPLNDIGNKHRLNGNTRAPVGLASWGSAETAKRGAMKEQKWDISPEITKEFLDPIAILPEEVEREEEVSRTAPKPKTQLTELRRRIEERLDCRRIDLEFEFEELEEQTDNLK